MFKRYFAFVNEVKKDLISFFELLTANYPLIRFDGVELLESRFADVFG